MTASFTPGPVKGEPVLRTVKPMLAKDADLSKVSWPQYGQPKLDGIRAMVVGGRLLSRTLKPIPNAEIREAMERPEFEGFDGELVVGDPTAPDAYRRTTSFVMAESKTGEPWAFHAFDLWNSTAPYGMRYARLHVLVERVTHEDAPVFMVHPRRLDSLDDLDTYEADLLACGHEGVILRDPAGLYKFGRSGKSGPLLKVKRFIDFEAEVVGVYEEQHNGNEARTNALGRTERSSHAAGKVGKNTLGGLVLVAINGPAEGVEFRCGTGFDADTRKALWLMAEYDDHGNRRPGFDGLNGEVAKIKSFPIGAKDKPRHPVFLGWRDMAVDG